MSASLDYSALDALQARLEAVARTAGRLEFAQEVLQWAVANSEDLPQRLRDELAELILNAGAR